MPAPGVRITANSFDPDTGKSSMTDPFGKIYRFETDSDRSYTYYPNNTFTERIFDENGLLPITHKRMEPAAPANANGTETVPESFTYAYNNATGNITRITTASGEYTDYTCDLPDCLTCEEKKTQAGQRRMKSNVLREELKYETQQSFPIYFYSPNHSISKLLFWMYISKTDGYSTTEYCKN